MAKKMNLKATQDGVRQSNVVDVVPNSVWETIRKPHSRVVINYRQGSKVNYDTMTGSYSMLVLDFIKKYRLVSK